MRAGGRIVNRAIAGMALLLTGGAQAAALEVRLTNLRPTEWVQVSVYADEESWNRQRAPVAQRKVPAHDVIQTVRIDGLPPGRYAVRVRQDPNDGGVVEPASFAFSRRGWSRNSARQDRPIFERAAIEMGTEDRQLGIHMFVDSRH